MAVMLFLSFVTLLILLNILIARFTDTYQSAQKDAEKARERRMASVICRHERQSFFIDYRHDFYKNKMHGQTMVVSNLHKVKLKVETREMICSISNKMAWEPEYLELFITTCQKYWAKFIFSLLVL